MKRVLIKILIVLSSLLVLHLLLCLIVPQVIYSTIDKPRISDSGYNKYFSYDYEDIRNNLKANNDLLVSNGYDSRIYTYAIDVEEDLYIDTLYVKPEVEENLIVISTGVHGIEGYIGAVMVEVFFENFMDGIDMSNTGVVIVSNVNPYGVKNARRYNENNVDLNRNFIIDWDNFDLSVNKDYPLVKSFLEPKGKIGNYYNNELGFYSELAFQAVTNGVATVTNALVGGQYEYPEGVYYGGTKDELSTVYLKEVFNRIAVSNYENINYFDLHSGYGPRYGMTIFNSGKDPMTEDEAKEAYNYNMIIAHDSEEFYATYGDTTEYFYEVAGHKNLYATCFEFGTLGDGLLDSINSLKYTVEENQNHYYPTKNKTTQKIIDAHYMEMFYPSEEKWRHNAVESFIAAMSGVLNYRLYEITLDN